MVSLQCFLRRTPGSRSMGGRIQQNLIWSSQKFLCRPVSTYYFLSFIMFTSNIIYSKTVPAYEFCSGHKFVLLLENRFFLVVHQHQKQETISDSFWDTGFVLFISGWF